METRINNMITKLSFSKFRSSFHLKTKDIEYINDKGIQKIQEHAYDFINKRLSDISNVIDGKQTPMRGHPVFIAQHATATCCRNCLSKWHHIDKGRLLTEEEINYVIKIIILWINNEYTKKK